MVDNAGFDRVLNKVNIYLYFRHKTSEVFVTAVLQCYKHLKGFLQVNVMSAGPGKVVCELRVEEEHTNRGGTLHGGLTATLVDVISTMAIMNSERGAPGVSVDMNIT